MADTSDLCIVAFQPDAYGSAAQFLQRLKRLTFDVFPTEGEKFTATLEDLEIHPDTGQWLAVLKVWAGNDAEPGPDAEVRRLDIYDEIERMEVC